MEWARQPPIQRVQASRAHRSASRTHRRNLLWLLDAHRNRESLGRDECLASAFLAFSNILRFDDRRIGLASGFLAAICASGVIGSVFNPEIGWLTALGVFVAVAPAVHLMDTEPGWGCDGRNALAVIWATVTIALFIGVVH